jgi:hypothetical protein
MAKLPLNLIALNTENAVEYAPLIWDNGAALSDVSIKTFIRKRNNAETLRLSISSQLQRLALQIEHNQNKLDMVTVETANIQKGLTFLIAKYDILKLKFATYSKDLTALVAKLPNLTALRSQIRDTTLSELEENYSLATSTVDYLTTYRLNAQQTELDLDIMQVQLKANSTRVVSTIQNLINRTTTYQTSISALDTKISTLSKLSVSVDANISACTYIAATVNKSLKTLSDKQLQSADYLNSYNESLKAINDLYAENSNLLGNLEATVSQYKQNFNDAQCFYNEQEQKMQAILKACEKTSAGIDEYYDLFVGGNFIKKGDTIQLNRIGYSIIINAYLPALTECPRLPIAPPLGPDIKFIQDDLPVCPPPICTTTPAPTTTTTTTTTTAKPTCTFIIKDHNENTIIDDDLDLYVDGKFVQTFTGSTNPSTSYEMNFSSGTHTFEFKVKKPNGKGTAKQIEILRKSDNKQLAWRTVYCRMGTAVGTTIFSASIYLPCA